MVLSWCRIIGNALHKNLAELTIRQLVCEDATAKSSHGNVSCFLESRCIIVPFSDVCLLVSHAWRIFSKSADCGANLSLKRWREREINSALLSVNLCFKVRTITRVNIKRNNFPSQASIWRSRFFSWRAVLWESWKLRRARRVFSDLDLHHEVLLILEHLLLSPIPDQLPVDFFLFRFRQTLILN